MKKVRMNIKLFAFNFSLSAFNFQLFAFSLLLVTFSFQLSAQSVSINQTGAKPDPSAMLDVSSTDKGVLIPRVTKAQRNAISSPATGLMVFMTTDTVGFFYYNSAKWIPLLSAVNTNEISIQDADNDTKIQVEETTDEDIIRFDLGGTEYFRMNGPRLEVLNSGFGVFIGFEAGLNDNLNNSGVFIGDQAGKLNTTGESNVLLGYQSGSSLNTGSFNIGIGDNALNTLTSEESNIAIGYFTMDQSTGAGNIALGAEALSNFDGDSNTAIGVWSLYANSTKTGSKNTAIGAFSGEQNGGSNNVLLGYKAGSGNTFSNKLYIENSNSSTPLIWGDFANDSLKLNARGVNIIAPNGQDAVLSLSADLDNNNEDENPQIRLEQDGGGNRALIGLEGSNDLTVTGGGSNNLLVGTIDNEDVQFFTNNVAKITLDTDGDFGIGTASPSEKLHVFDSTATSRGIIESSSATGNAGLRLQTTFTTFDIENKYASGRLVFENRAGDDIFSMDSTLRVGIGTGFPSYTLDARNPNGDADISARSDFAGGDAQLKLRNLITTFDITNKGSTGKLIVENNLGADLVTIDTLGRVAIGTEPSSPYHSLSVSSPNIGGIMRLNQENTTLASELGFFVNDNFKWSIGGTDDANTNGESFFVYNNDRGATDLFIDGDNGRAGFGTTSPFGKIHIDNAGGDVAIMTSSSDAEIGYVTGTDFEIVGVNDSTGVIEERPFIITGGRVGIGTQAPIQKLDVRGSNTDDAAIITFGNSDRSHFMQLFPGRLNDPNPFIQWKSGDPLRFANDAFGFSELMRISEFGHLGIGTDNVVQQIDVLDTNATEVGIRLGADQTDQYVQLDYNVSGGFSSLQSGNFSGTPRDLILQGGGGNVGIGTTSPDRPLTILKALTGDAAQVRISNGAGAEFQMGITGSGANQNSFLKTNANEDLYFQIGQASDATTPDLVITSGGNLIMGSTTQPTIENKIDILIGEDEIGFINVRDPDNNVIARIGDGSSTNEIGIMQLYDASNNENVRIWANPTGNSWIMGNLGIGTPTPAQKLDVNGNIASTGLTTAGIGINTGVPSGVELDIRSSLNHLMWLESSNTSTLSTGITIRLGVATPTVSTTFVSFRQGSGGLVGSITGNGGGGVQYNTSSDRRLKQNIKPLENSLELIGKIEPRVYERKLVPGVNEHGFIAQELQLIYPQVVAGDSTNSVEENPMSVDYSKLTPLLTAGVKELHEMVKTQQVIIDSLNQKVELKENEIEGLKSEVKTQNQRLNLLENFMEATQQKTQNAPK